MEHIASKIIRKDLCKEIDEVRKNLKSILSKDHKKQAHLSNFNNIIDIARCRCFINRPKEDFSPDNCLCTPDKKIANFQTYYDQLFDQDSVLLVSEEEKLEYLKTYKSKSSTSFLSQIVTKLFKGSLFFERIFQY